MLKSYLFTFCGRFASPYPFICLLPVEKFKEQWSEIILSCQTMEQEFSSWSSWFSSSEKIFWSSEKIFSSSEKIFSPWTDDGVRTQSLALLFPRCLLLVEARLTPPLDFLIGFHDRDRHHYYGQGPLKHWLQPEFMSNIVTWQWSLYMQVLTKII